MADLFQGYPKLRGCTLPHWPHPPFNCLKKSEVLHPVNWNLIKVKVNKSVTVNTNSRCWEFLQTVFIFSGAGTPFRVQKHTVPTHLRQVILSVGQLVWVPVYSSKGQLNIYKYVGHNSFAHFSGQVIITLLVLSVLSNLPKGQVELRVGQEKQKTHLPSTGQVDLNFFFLALAALPFPDSLRKHSCLCPETIHPIYGLGFIHSP